MIDRRIGSRQFHTMIPNSKLEDLDSGDIMIIGSSGTQVGVEYKTFGEMVSSCQGNKRLVGSQLTKMEQDYDDIWLVIGGYHKIKNDMLEFRRRGLETIQYSTFTNHLLSLMIKRNVKIMMFWSDKQAAAFITTLYNWYQQEDSHRSHQGVYAGRTELLRRPTLTHLWAHALPGVEQELSKRVVKKFATPLQLANADVKEWQSIDGIGKIKSQSIIKAIRGEK